MDAPIERSAQVHVGDHFVYERIGDVTAKLTDALAILDKSEVTEEEAKDAYLAVYRGRRVLTQLLDGQRQLVKDEAQKLFQRSTQLGQEEQGLDQMIERAGGLS